MSVQGYCPSCHELRVIPVGSRCPVCGTALVDIQPAGPAVAEAAVAVEPSSPPDPERPVAAVLVRTPGPAGAPTRRERFRMVRLVVLTLLAVILGIVGLAILVDEYDDASDGGRPIGSESTGSDGGDTDDATASPEDATAQGSVVVTSSRAFTDESSLLLDGEARRFTFVAMLRNDGTSTAWVTGVTIRVVDAAGTQVGLRYADVIDPILDPGESTFLTETTPSMFYVDDEDNSYPDGWASWETTVDADPSHQPEAGDEMTLTATDVAVVPSGSTVVVTGSVLNDTGVALSAGIEVYVALLDADGNLVNLATTTILPDDGSDLAPNGTLPFEFEVSSGPTEFVSSVVGAVGTPAR